MLPIIPKDIAVLLNEIAERLWSGHASVMVGAGFSKNAVRNSNSSKPFLSWNELADIFYEKLYGNRPGMPGSNERYLNPLKLAEEVCAAFGRPALEKLMQASLPDLDYSPSDLHRDLLELEWNDVFTTNYDSLLERTKVSHRRYDVVLNKSDLVFSQRPRIIKLHGSFPSHRPFIITEEDYRIYPRENAPFVNTVQQSLIENTLCLIGFSGDDPNFLNWIGWIRDNLGAPTSPRIYLVGALSLTPSQVKVLEQRNIGIIDLSSCVVNEADKHQKALQIFIDFLKSKKAEKNRLDWPDKEISKHSLSHNTSDENSIAEISAVSAQWKKTREEYPGWVICPSDCRQVLWSRTSGWLHGRHLKVQLPLGVDISFWRELVWRLEKSLSPIYDHIALQIETTVARYSGILRGEAPDILPSEAGEFSILSNDLVESWLYLTLSLLRYYREEGLADKWKGCLDTLEKNLGRMSYSQRDTLRYEQALFYLFRQEISQFRSVLKSWKPDDSAPFSISKKAGLLAELGETAEAEELLENALQLVRSQLNLTPITTDYSHLSQESYILLLLSYLKNVKSFASDGEKDRKYIEEFNLRWTFLKKYKCDPWGELKLFEAKLKGRPKKLKEIEVKYGFDIGASTTSRHFGSDEEAREAFAFLRYSDDVGLPYRVKNMTMGKEPAIGAIKRIAGYTPHWALATLLRTGDEKSVEILFGRKSMQKMSSDEIETLADVLLKLLRELTEDINRVDQWWYDGNIGTHYASIVPEIISRLCTRCSFEKQKAILDFLLEIYKSDHKNKYSHIDDLTKRLVRSWPVEHLSGLVSLVISEFPVIADSQARFARDFPDPLDFIDRDFEIKNVKVSPSVIDCLLNDLEHSETDSREHLVKRIERAFTYGLLSEEQKEEFGRLLWKHVDENGFPANLNMLYRWYFLELPHPVSINVEKLLFGFLKAIKFPTVGKSKSIAITGGRGSPCSEIIHAKSALDKIGWTTDDALNLLLKIQTWWNTDKSNFRPNDSAALSERVSEMRNRFQLASQALAVAVVPYLSGEKLKLERDTIETLAGEMGSHEISVIELKVAMFLRNAAEFEDLLRDISIEVLSDDTNRINRVFYAIRCLLEADTDLSDADRSRTLSLVVDAVKWRKSEALIQALAALRFLLALPFVSSAHLQNVLIGLDCLILESNLLTEHSPIPFHDRLFVRKMAAALSRSLYGIFLAKGDPIPTPLENWKSICQDTTEFAEIRNEWAKN